MRVQSSFKSIQTTIVLNSSHSNMKILIRNPEYREHVKYLTFHKTSINDTIKKQIEMLRLAIVNNFNILSKNVAANIDQTVIVNRIASHLKQTSNVTSYRPFSFTTARLCQENVNSEEEGEDKVHPWLKKWVGTERDRTKIIPVEKSIEYMQSAAYQSTYGDKKVWQLYRRVHKGQFARRNNRRSCISHQVVTIGSPCPVCRDEYLVLDYRNLELLKQFISPHTGEVRQTSHIFIHYCEYSFVFFINLQVLPENKSGLCQKQQVELAVHLDHAYDLGLLEYQVPFREFNYADYYDVSKLKTYQPK